ncbi:HTH-type transcriptional regulator DmlR (plasmid) [Pseudosulfitobacter pseudonitzschiae]|uniref:HTH-type transcriptional regulator DmlR n=1 Tax=Pseudosulfitobacter pseudonitzschiae TaxID=1402135 RepID=A0A221K9B0_9RHOB|nr:MULTISPECIES: LysR family transcriptional regulator [Roseobacteraceae]ASM75450.1 HTH-type transcriptional regulator DmlR [Pseudosulfitobacter pseudonitzschiae]
MKWDTVAFDWNQARAFLATIEEGSLSAAARALGQTQPTLSRQVAQLEDVLGIELFRRVGRSLVPTEAAFDLLDHVRAMRDAALGVSLAASGRSQAIEGRVSITATNFMATRALPPVLKRLRAIAPGIEVEIIASNELRNLMRREADIAIRHARPEQPELIARLVNETAANLYASTEFLDRCGHPQSHAELETLDFIGFEHDHAERLLPILNERGIMVTRQNFRLVSASGSVILELVRQGLGIGLMSRDMAATAPGLSIVLPDFQPIPVPVWLVTHRELHTSRRIRLVFDLLADALSRDAPHRDLPV